MNWGGKRLTREEREEILNLYLKDPAAGTALAMSYGLSQIYAYKLAHERGVAPLQRMVPKATGKSHAQKVIEAQQEFDEAFGRHPRSERTTVLWYKLRDLLTQQLRKESRAA